MTAVTTEGAPSGLVELPKRYGAHSAERRTLGDGLRLYRRREHCKATGHDYFVYEQDLSGLRLDHSKPRPEIWTANGLSPGEIFAMHRRLCERGGFLDLRPDDPARLELELLGRLGLPLVASLVRASIPPPPEILDPAALFGLGPCIRISDVACKVHRVTPDEVLPLARLHCVGNFGIHGMLPTVKPDSDEEWVPEKWGQRFVNAAAIASGRGVIRSRYSIFRPTIDRPGYVPNGPMTHERPREENAWVEIATQLRLDMEPETICFSSKDTP